MERAEFASEVYEPQEAKAYVFFSEDKMQPRGNNSIVLSFHLHFLLIIPGITAAQMDTFLHTIQHS